MISQKIKSIPDQRIVYRKKCIGALCWALFAGNEAIQIRAWDFAVKLRKLPVEQEEPFLESVHLAEFRIYAVFYLAIWYRVEI